MMRVWISAFFILANSAAADVFDDPPFANVVILGEIHDNPVHHENQARALRALTPSAIVFEMLTPEQANLITVENRTSPDEIAKAVDWGNSGWPDFAIYRPVFAAIGEAEVYGAQVPRDRLMAAVMGDAVTAFGEGASRFGLDQPLDEETQSAREALQMAAHCDALPANMLPGMVMAQRLRDAMLARAVVQAFDATGGPIAVITGNGHARTDWGVPALLATGAPDLTVVSIGQGEAGIDIGTPHSLTTQSDPAERGDPCEAFR